MSVEGDEYGGFSGAIREMRDLLVRLIPADLPGEGEKTRMYVVPAGMLREARRAVERYDAMEARLVELAGQKQSPAAETH
jgi:hypothetical protein